MSVRAATALLLALLGACDRERTPPAQTRSTTTSAQPQRLVDHRLESAPLAVDRDFVTLEMPFGEQRSTEVQLIGPLASEARIVLKPAEKAGFGVDVVPASAGKAARLRFRVRGETVGVHVGRLVFATGLPDPAELAVNYTWKVTGTLRVEPTNPLIELGIPKTVVIDVRSTRPNLVISAVEVSEGPFVASFERAEEPGQYWVKVVSRASGSTSQARGAAGKLVIFSNDAAEPKKEIPLLGIGAPRR